MGLQNRLGGKDFYFYRLVQGYCFCLVEMSVGYTKKGLLVPSRCEEKSIIRITGKRAGHQWLTPVILATQEAQIRRIAV
jgi:hypothetical protein